MRIVAFSLFICLYLLRDLRRHLSDLRRHRHHFPPPAPPLKPPPPPPRLCPAQAAACAAAARDARLWFPRLLACLASLPRSEPLNALLSLPCCPAWPRDAPAPPRSGPPAGCCDACGPPMPWPLPPPAPWPVPADLVSSSTCAVTPSIVAPHIIRGPRLLAELVGCSLDPGTQRLYGSRDYASTDPVPLGRSTLCSDSCCG